MTIKRLFLLVLTLTFAGCESAPARRAPQAEAVQSAVATSSQTAASAEAAADPIKAKVNEEAAIASALEQLSKGKNDYLIAPADLISVQVYQDQEMNRRVRVGQNGAISLPLVGQVQVGGLTVVDAEAAIALALKKYLVNPQVTLFIEEYGNKTIYVLGEVTRPGSYPIPAESRLTVLEAVSTAGGFTPIAAQDRTKVLRKVNGQSQSIHVEVTAITQKGEKDKDIQLQPNDIVYVPQAFF